MNRRIKDIVRPIDLVYLWVDDSDENWIKKRDSFLNFESRKDSVFDCRFRDNDELKMSLRSVEKYLPWINKIFVVTDGQIPRWLDIENPKIEVVFHEQFIPQEYLPTFNSNVIEAFLHKIPNLSEHFLYANDDVFVNQNLTPDFFFNKKGQPIARLHKIIHKKNEKLNYYHSVIKKAQNLIEKKYGIKYNFEGHHCVDAYTKTLYADCVREFESEYKFFYGNRFRQKNDIQRVLVLLYGLANKKVQLKKVKKSRLHIPIGTKFFNMLVGRYFIDSCFLGINKDNISERFSWVKPKMFCLNDNVNATERNRIDASIFLYSLFPQKSCFEKENRGNKISVVVPVYNTAKYLPKCLDSLINQTLKEIEIICVNDGSEDDSLKILEGYAQKDSRIKILNQDNKGVSVARNNAIKVASGQYLTFVDSDDWLELDACQKIYDKITDDCSDVLVFSHVNVYSENRKKIHKLLERCKCNLVKKTSVDEYVEAVIGIVGSVWAKLYSRNFLLKHNLFFNSLLKQSEDQLFWYDVISTKPRISVLNKALYNYLNERAESSFSDLDISIKRQYDFNNEVCASALYKKCTEYNKMIIEDRGLNFYINMWYKHKNKRESLVNEIEKVLQNFDLKFANLEKNKLKKYNNLKRKLIKYNGKIRK